MMSPSSKPTTPRKAGAAEDPDLSVESIQLDSPVKLPGTAGITSPVAAQAGNQQEGAAEPEEDTERVSAEEEACGLDQGEKEDGQDEYVDSLVRDAQSEVSVFTKTPFADVIDLDIASEEAVTEGMPSADPAQQHQGEEAMGEGSVLPPTMTMESGGGITGRLVRLSQNTVAAAKDQWKTVVDSAGPHLKQAGNSTTALVGSTWQAVAEQTNRVREDGLLHTTQALVGSTWQAVAEQTSKVRDEGIVHTTQAIVGSTFQVVAQTTQRAAASTRDLSRPYVDRLLENPQVGSIVGKIQEASVGAGSIAVTVAAATKERVTQAIHRSPESTMAQLADEEAWKEILSIGGAELVVPARDEVTTQFIVPKGSILQWQFRVEAFDVGFAVRLRAQGDGGASESDVFTMQRYGSGVTVRGEWSPAHDSVLVVVWHNKFSMLRAKKIVFQASVRKINVKGVEEDGAECPMEGTGPQAQDEDQVPQLQVKQGDATPTPMGASSSSPEGGASPAASAKAQVVRG